MKRKLLEKLIIWRKKNNKPPLLLIGAKGTGKTYTAWDFSKNFYNQNTIYINFERDFNSTYIFLNLEYNQILNALLKSYSIKNITPEEPLLIILDEISYCKEAVTFFLENSINDNIDIIMISSFEMKPLYSPMDIINVYPMDFKEFLWATGNEWYISVITEHFISNKKIPEIVHMKLLDLLAEYIVTGGLPSAINEYIGSDSTINLPEQHNNILNTYFQYIRELSPEGEGVKIISAYKTIPEQLIKTNKKFQYKLIRKGATRKLYEDSINFLEFKHFTIKCKKINGDINNPSFKLYSNDTGILNTLSQKYITNSKKDSSIYKGILENYVIQSLAANGYTPYFWESSSQAKIDFVIEKKSELNENYIPIELFIDRNTRSKSLSIIKKEYDIKESIKISARNFEYSKDIKYVPLYAVFCI